MAGKETAVYVTAGSTSSGARARSGTRRRRRRRRVRRGEETRRRGIRRTETAVLAGEPSKRNMAAGCCGAKKQRLGVGGVGGGATPSLSSCDGTVIRHSVPHPRKPTTIAQPEMGFFCFDVLYCQLHQLDPPKAPNFSNEALWVALALDICIYLFLCLSVSIFVRLISCVASAVISVYLRRDALRMTSLSALRRLRFLRLNFEITKKGPT